MFSSGGVCVLHPGRKASVGVSSSPCLHWDSLKIRPFLRNSQRRTLRTFLFCVSSAAQFTGKSFLVSKQKWACLCTIPLLVRCVWSKWDKVHPGLGLPPPSRVPGSSGKVSRGGDWVTSGGQVPPAGNQGEPPSFRPGALSLLPLITVPRLRFTSGVWFLESDVPGVGP